MTPAPEVLAEAVAICGPELLSRILLELVEAGVSVARQYEADPALFLELVEAKRQAASLRESA